MMSSTTTAVKPANMPTKEQITQRAHEIWIAEGRPEGRALQHWQRAEKELCAKAGGNGDMSQSAGKSRLKLNVPNRKIGSSNQY